MNKFIHEILCARTKTSAISSNGNNLEAFLRNVTTNKLIYFGEFHGEHRIIALQTELIKSMSSRFSSSLFQKNDKETEEGACPRYVTSDSRHAHRRRVHVIMEHFSIEMQPLLNKYQTQYSYTYDDLKRQYEDIGTEGHDLDPYKSLLEFCRSTTLPDSNQSNKSCEVRLHGGFIPRPLASQWNKCKDDKEMKSSLLSDMYIKDILPSQSSPMNESLFQDLGNMILRGSKEHYLLIESLLSGRDLYDPSNEEDANLDIFFDSDKSSSSSLPDPPKLFNLYQAQILKDYSMAYTISKLLLQHHSSSLVTPLYDDRYLIIAGYGHLKHYCGVPMFVQSMLRSQALNHEDVTQRRDALEVLLELNGKGDENKGRGNIIIGSQMLYEAYLEDRLLKNEVETSEQNDDDADGDSDDEEKQHLINSLYQNNRRSFAQYLLESDIVHKPLMQYAHGGFDYPAADYLFVYDEDDDNVLIEKHEVKESQQSAQCPIAKKKSAITPKEETKLAYNNVGSTASHKGNIAKARAIMTYLGYTSHDMDIIGDDDLYNFQGVANPHKVAKIQYGEKVLDIGCGLGCDSFLAAAYACGDDGSIDKKYDNKNITRKGDNGEGGMVVGIDLSIKEIQHVQIRAAQRGYNSKQIMFFEGDAEKLNVAFEREGFPLQQDEEEGECFPSAHNFFDVVISNGAFCLIPNKRKAFQNVYNVLKPGGRMAISTTTILPSKSLDSDLEWPVCMRMFAHLDEISGICEDIGFKNVSIVDADSPLEGMELPEEEENEDSNIRVEEASDGSKKAEKEKKRFKIHGRYSEEFEHLGDMDMDALCKVVTVYATK